MYEIEAENDYEDLNNDKQLFGFSNHLKDSKYYNNTNNLVVGQMKDETRAMSIKG